MKLICSVVAVMAMLSPTVIPSLYPPPTDPLSLFHWKLVLVGVSILAVLAYALQQILQYRGDRQREREDRAAIFDLSARLAVLLKQDRERDKHFQELAALIPKPRPPMTAPLEVEPISEEYRQRLKRQDLRRKVIQLGNDLFDFMREKGADPEVALDKTKSLREQIKQVMDERGPYVEGIHYGYLARFKDRVVQMFNELAENGIPMPDGLQQWELAPSQVQRAETVRKIAENLFLVAAKMDIAEASKGT